MLAVKHDVGQILTSYALSLGITIAEFDASGLPILTIDFSSIIEGRPGAFHGGATSGLLETAGYAALRTALTNKGLEPTLKPINITVQFLSAGKRKQTYAVGRITRLGRRTANINVEAWQDSPDRPIATAVMNILMATRSA
jgi:uncharacterized protein (TIGR00369 family)